VNGFPIQKAKLKSKNSVQRLAYSGEVIEVEAEVKVEKFLIGRRLYRLVMIRTDNQFKS
jgi:hypothetical protein